MAARRNVKGNTGNRYTSAEKLRILTFIEAHDAKKGRGGMAAAVRKFEIPQLTAYRWRAAALKANKKLKQKPAKG